MGGLGVRFRTCEPVPILVDSFSRTLGALIRVPPERLWSDETQRMVGPTSARTSYRSVVSAFG